MRETPENLTEGWSEARLTGIARFLRLAMSVVLALGAVVLFVVIDPELRDSPLVLALIASVILASIYDAAKVIRTRLYWNDTGILRQGLFGKSRVHKWSDLTHVEKSMHHRASVLTFKGLWSVKVYWAYKAHRELATLAKQKRKENKASRKWRKSSKDTAQAEAPNSEMAAPEFDMRAASSAPDQENTVRVEPKLTATRQPDA